MAAANVPNPTAPTSTPSDTSKTPAAAPLKAAETNTQPVKAETPSTPAAPSAEEMNAAIAKAVAEATKAAEEKAAEATKAAVEKALAEAKVENDAKLAETKTLEEARVAAPGVIPKPNQSPNPDDLARRRLIRARVGIVRDAKDAALPDEPLVKMNFPREIHLTLQDRSVVHFARGFNMVPESLSTHKYLEAVGAKAVEDPGVRELPPIQTGSAAKTAPVK